METAALSIEDGHVKGPLDELVVLYSELNENSTRFERLVAAPSHEETELMWLIIGIVTIICTAVVLVISASVLASPIRNKTFNVYLLCLMFPEILFGLMCSTTCLQNYVLGYFSSMPMCWIQTFYVMLAISANGWLNAVICKQVHHMLLCVKQKRTYQPPPNPVVLGHAALVYLWAMFVSSWVLFGVPLENYGIRWWPLKPALTAGFACFPMDYDATSTVFFYCVFFPCLLGIPLAYTVYLVYDIWRKELLPPKGKRRQMTLYMVRLIAIFLLMWTPAILLLFVLAPYLNPWVPWLGGLWCHLQGAVSALFGLYKPDVRHAVQNFVRCRCSENKAQLLSEKEARKAKKYDKLLQKTQKQLKEVEEQLSSAHQTGATTQYTKELEDLAQELHHTKETAEKKAVELPLDVCLLEDFGEDHNKRSRGFSRQDLPSMVQNGPFMSTLDSLGDSQKKFSQGSTHKDTESEEVNEERFETQSDRAFEAYAAYELATCWTDSDTSSSTAPDESACAPRKRRVGFATFLDEISV